MIKLAAFDIDGTLLYGPNKQILDSTKETLKKLKEKGIRIAIATGRSFAFLPELLKTELGFDYFVCSNGNDIRDAYGNCISRSKMPSEDVIAITKDFEEDGLAIFYQFTDRSFSYVNHEKCLKHFMDFVGMKDVLLDGTNKRDYHYSEAPVQGVGHMPEHLVAKYQEKYKNYDIIHYGVDGYDIVLKGTSKASGLKILCEKLEYSVENIIAFGDHLNDLEMIKTVGVGVAMGNALEELKEHASFITKDCDDHGIAYACKHFELI